MISSIYLNTKHIDVAEYVSKLENNSETYSPLSGVNGLPTTPMGPTKIGIVSDWARWKTF